MPQLRIISSVTSDLRSDQRVHRICDTLSGEGHHVLLIGRRRRNSGPLADLSESGNDYDRVRMSLLFEKGPLFYASFNLALFFKLLFKKADLLISNDLDTILANSLVSRIRNIPFIYDSHEYFTEVPELIHRPLVRRAWLLIEKLCIRSASAWMTVSPSIAREYNDRYGIDMRVVRNFPRSQDISAEKMGSKGDRKVILYQGSVNLDRGLEEMMEAMEDLVDFELYICGEGDVLEKLKAMRKTLSSVDRIHFTGRIDFEELSVYTRRADLGISIEKKNGLSYTYALPNKVFDYLQAGLPVLISSLPEVVKLNDESGFARVIEHVDPGTISSAIKNLFDDEEGYNTLKQNAQKAAELYNWDKEKVRLLEVVNEVFSPS